MNRIVQRHSKVEEDLRDGSSHSPSPFPFPQECKVQPSRGMAENIQGLQWGRQSEAKTEDEGSDERGAGPGQFSGLKSLVSHETQRL